MDQNSPEKNKDNQSAQSNQENGQETTKVGAEKNNSSWQIVLTVIAIIAIILIFALPDRKKNDGIISGEDNTETIETEGSATSTENGSTEESTNTGPSTNSGFMTPIAVDNEFVYSFSGIDWFFESVDEGTVVEFKFSEFSRREGSIVAFGNPYRLGVFPGTCTEVSSLAIGNATDTPLAYVSCRTEGNTGSDIALFQDGAKVYAAQRTVENGKSGDFSEFFSRDITTIVR